MRPDRPTIMHNILIIIITLLIVMHYDTRVVGLIEGLVPFMLIEFVGNHIHYSSQSNR